MRASLPTVFTNAADTQAETAQPVGEHACLQVLDRRRFLRDISIAVGAALVAGGLAPSPALAGRLKGMTPLMAAANERTYNLPAADGVWVDIANRVALVRVAGQVFAFSLECPHRGRLMEWNDSEGRFYCPKHKARFTADGQHASGRRTPDLDRFALRREQARVIVSIDRVLSVTDNPAEWRTAALAV